MLYKLNKVSMLSGATEFLIIKWLPVFLSLLFILISVSGTSQASQDQDVFVPTSNWLVGEAMPMMRDEKTGPVPCVMYNQFDNGYGVRIAGAETVIYAIAIDFRQPVFETGESYQLDLKFPPEFSATVAGEAHNSATLIIETRKFKDIFNTLREADTMRISIGPNALDFSLLGARRGLLRLAACSGDISAVEEVTFFNQALQPDSLYRKQERLLPFTRDKKNNSMLPEETTEDRITAMQDWEEGRIYENKEGYPPREVQKKTKESVREKRDILIESGNYDSTRMSKAENISQARQWRAIKGASLRDTLSNWSAHADAKLLWQLDRDFSVRESLSINARFEAAVLQILQQYNSLEVRPLGRIYNVTESSKDKAETILVIEEE